MDEVDRQLMDRLRAVLHSLDPAQLQSIGVRLERPDPDRWVWLRDIMADVLENLGRNRAASNLRDYPFSGVHTAYSVGVTADLLAGMASAIQRRFEDRPTTATPALKGDENAQG